MRGPCFSLAKLGEQSFCALEILRDEALREAAMDGAKLVGTNSFTSPELTIPLASPTKAQYVIVVIKALPKLAAPKTQYNFGLRLAEVSVQ